MQPKVTKTSKTCFATNSSPALQQQICRTQRAKRLQQHQLLKLLKLHCKEFLGTLSFQIKHTTLKKVTQLSKCPLEALGEPYNFKHSHVFHLEPMSIIFSKTQREEEKVDCLIYFTLTRKSIRDIKSEVQPAITCKICPLYFMNFTPCICILLFCVS